MALENKTLAKTKRIKRSLSESSSESEHETDESFYQSIVLESIEETPVTKLSPFLIQKTIEAHCKPINIKNTSYKLHHYYTNNKLKTIRKNY